MAGGHWGSGGGARPRVARSSHAGGAALVALLGLLVGVLALPAPGAPVVEARAFVAAPTATPTVTPTPSTPPTLAYVAPTSGRGPVGAHITLTGQYWTAANVAIGAATSPAVCGTPSNWAATFTTARPQNGSFVAAFTWPTSLAANGTVYTLCANATSAPLATPPSLSYQLLSASPPALSLSLTRVQAGTAVTITGANFVGTDRVALTALSSTGVRSLAQITPAADGSFTFDYTPADGDVGALTLSAASPLENGVQVPVLQASATMSVLAAPTPTAVVTPTVAPTATSAAASPTPGTQSGGPGALFFILLVAGLLTLALIGVGVYLLVRRGPPGPGGPGGPPPGGPGSGPLPPPPGRYAGAPPVGGITDPRAGVRVGGVAQWEDEAAGPGPEWQPRPMGGTRAWQSAEVREPYASETFPGAPAWQENPPGAPPDPWAGASAGWGPPPGARPPAGAPPPPSSRPGATDGWGDAATRESWQAPRPAPPPRDEPGW